MPLSHRHKKTEFTLQLTAEPKLSALCTTCTSSPRPSRSINAVNVNKVPVKVPHPPPESQGDNAVRRRRVSRRPRQGRQGQKRGWLRSHEEQRKRHKKPEDARVQRRHSQHEQSCFPVSRINCRHKSALRDNQKLSRHDFKRFLSPIDIGVIVDKLKIPSLEKPKNPKLIRA